MLCYWVFWLECWRTRNGNTIRIIDFMREGGNMVLCFFERYR